MNVNSLNSQLKSRHLECINTTKRFNNMLTKDNLKQKDTVKNKKM